MIHPKSERQTIVITMIGSLLITIAGIITIILVGDINTFKSFIVVFMTSIGMIIAAASFIEFRKLKD